MIELPILLRDRVLDLVSCHQDFYAVALVLEHVGGDHHGGRLEPEEPADLCAHGRLPREIPTSATWASY